MDAEEAEEATATTDASAVRFDDNEKLENALGSMDSAQKLMRRKTAMSLDRMLQEETPKQNLDRRASTPEVATKTSRSGSKTSRSGSKSLPDSKSEPGNLSSSGIVADFIDRGKAAAGESHIPAEEYLTKILNATQAHDQRQMVILKGVLQSEQLFDRMMRSITIETKARGLFEPTPPDTLPTQARLICGLYKVRHMITVAVDNWLFRRRLLSHAVIHTKEAKRERQARLSEFYETYRPNTCEQHTGSSPGYKMAFNLGIQKNAVNGMKWEAQKPAGTLVHQYFEEEELLTENRRPEDPRGDGRFPSEKMKRGHSAGSIPKNSFVKLKPIRSAKSQYFQDCHKNKTVPVPSMFATGHTRRFTADGHLYTDAEMLNFTSMVDHCPGIEVLDLKDNGLLTDRSMVPFLEKLCCERLSVGLQHLSLDSCSRLGTRTVGSVLELARAAVNLRSLNLSGLPLGSHQHVALCQAIGMHSTLESINLSKTGIGVSPVTTMDCLTKLLTNKAVKKLDVGWNRFYHEEFQHMGKLITQGTLRELYVDSSSAYVVGRDSPVNELIEALNFDRSLERLSLAANRMDFTSGLVFEDSLESHPVLKQLIMTDNPLGAMGMRNLLRLLSRKSNALIHFESEGCYHGAATEFQGMSNEDITCPIFSFTNPGSKYNLDLSRPYHRSLLRMLYKSAERYKLDCTQAFQDVVYSEGTYQHPTQDRGVWQVENCGRLKFCFSVETQIRSAVTGIADYDFLGFLDTHFEMTRFKADMKKITPLFAKWRELDGRELDQDVYLDALAKDFNMTLPYLAYICSSSPAVALKAMVKLFPTLPCDQHSRYLALLNFPRLQDMFSCQPKIENLLQFNAQNPTGHYKLDLGNCCDFAVAQRLVLLDSWERVVDARRGRLDVSKRANRSHLRNEHHQGKPLRMKVKSVAEWSLPEFDVFETDYMSAFRVPPTADTLSDHLWQDLMVTMYRSGCRPEDKIKVLRNISHNIFITSMHMRQMVGYFKDAEIRREAFVMFYLRVVDMHNQKQFRVRFAAEQELLELRNRLGYAAFFPFLQPENAKFSLNLAFHDQRLCTNILVSLSLKEKQGNIREYQFIHPDGTVDSMTMGVPRGWAEYEKTPTLGTFECRYVCSPEDRNVPFRFHLAEIYSYLEMPDISGDDISWWTGLNEVGEDVLDLLEFFISRYEHVNEAFVDIDGGVQNADGGGGGNTTSNGELTLREFEAGLKDIGCKKFKGPNEQQRIANIFRYLDPGQEGSVSLGEWQILDQLWKEFDLSIQEFVQFLIFVFGEDLQVAWDNLDASGDGELDEEEWSEAVEAIGYFGPAHVVFALLDGSDDGNISFDEFQVLEKYKAKLKARQERPRRANSKLSQDSSRRPSGA